MGSGSFSLWREGWSESPAACAVATGREPSRVGRRGRWCALCCAMSRRRASTPAPTPRPMRRCSGSGARWWWLRTGWVRRAGLTGWPSWLRGGWWRRARLRLCCSTRRGSMPSCAREPGSAGSEGGAEAHNESAPTAVLGAYLRSETLSHQYPTRNATVPAPDTTSRDVAGTIRHNKPHDLCRHGGGGLRWRQRRNGARGGNGGIMG
mmetsp:Transcript_37786/g.121479  ORF Transcript_37786/g.121479 Transcript_37786/m.121479 type:complete len:207 (-) Transcript_37786:479-1099(-)